MHTNHPFPGPHFSEVAVGSMSIGLEGGARQGPDVPCKFCYLSTPDTVTLAWVGAGQHDSIGFGVLLSQNPTYFPVDNLNRLFLVGDDSTTVATYFVMR